MYGRRHMHKVGVTDNLRENSGTMCSSCTPQKRGERLSATLNHPPHRRQQTPALGTGLAPSARTTVSVPCYAHVTGQLDNGEKAGAILSLQFKKGVNKAEELDSRGPRKEGRALVDTANTSACEGRPQTPAIKPRLP
jgi:hypothetical protein